MASIEVEAGSETNHAGCRTIYAGCLMVSFELATHRVAVLSGLAPFFRLP